MQNPTVAQPPNPPQAPATSQGGGGSGGGGTTLQGYTPPRTAQEVSALKARRSELSNQLESAEGRRNRLAESASQTEGADKAGLVNRVQLLDQRILQLEADIAQTGRLLATAPSELVAGTETPRGMDWLRNNSGPPLEIFFMLFVLAPMAIGFARWMWRRGTSPAPARDEESAGRLVRLEQSVDAIAIEVERISEGQRFITRLFTEGSSNVAALGAGAAPAEPIRVARDEAVPVSRSSS